MSKGPAPDVLEIEQAKRNAAVAKERVQSTAGALKQRLNPKNLAADAVDTVREKTAAVGDRASDVARRRPAVVTAAAGLATLIIFRKPVKKIGRRLFSRSYKAELRERKEAKRVAKRDAKAARKARRANQSPEVEAATPPDDLIPHAAATEASAAPAKQE
jgi:hypothetical protein